MMMPNSSSLRLTFGVFALILCVLNWSDVQAQSAPNLTFPKETQSQINAPFDLSTQNNSKSDGTPEGLSSYWTPEGSNNNFWTSDYIHTEPWCEAGEERCLDLGAGNDNIGRPGNGYSYDGHTGTDVDGTKGDVVVSAHDGVVKIFVEEVPDEPDNCYKHRDANGVVVWKNSRDKTLNYEGAQCGGNYVVLINTEEPSIWTYYGHLEQYSITPEVKNSLSSGTVIPRGTPLGKIGLSGNTTGAHLHFGVKVDVTESSKSLYYEESSPLVDPYQRGLWSGFSDNGLPVLRANIPPIAKLSANPNATTPGTPVEFDGSASEDEDGEIASWVWDFGDGQTGEGQQSQHVFAEIGTYVVTLKVTDNLGASHISQPVQIVVAEAGQSRQISAALVIDASNSMENDNGNSPVNDPDRRRVSAAIAFINRANIGDKISIVEFDVTPRVLAPLTEIQTQEDRDYLIERVNRVTSTDGTDIGVGLDSALQQLQQDSSDRVKVSILLTDGENNDDRPYQDQHRSYPDGWRIYTVGLGGTTDESLLVRIARDTGAEFYEAPTAGNLEKIYADISGQIQGSTTIFQRIINFLQESPSVLETVTVPYSLSALFEMFWPGSDYELVLIQPDGTRVPVDDSDPNIERVKTPTSEFYRILLPQSGQWQLEITPLDVPPGGEDVTVRVSIQDVIPPEGSVVINDGGYLTYDTDVSLVLAVTDEKPLGDEIGNFDMRISNDGIEYTSWIPYQPTINWSLTPGEGIKSVYAQFRDAAGNVSLSSVDYIIVDQTPPDTIITVGPAEKSTTPNVSFSFAGLDPSSFEAAHNDSNEYSYFLEGYACGFTAFGEENGANFILPTGTYTMHVQSRDLVGNVDSTPATQGFAVDTGSGTQVPLNQGWNLVSFGITPVEPSVFDVMAPVDGKYDMVLSYSEGPLSYYPHLDDIYNTLQVIDYEHGYWVKSSDTCPIPAFGARVPVDTPIGLKRGWNLVSYLPKTSLAIQDALESIDGKYTSVLGFEIGALSFYPQLSPEMNTLRTLTSGHGYWINMLSDASLIYPAIEEAEVSSASVDNVAAVADGITPTHQWINLYGLNSRLNGLPIPAGSVVTAFDPDGVKIGEVTVKRDGQFGIMAVYGDDPTTPEDEGAKIGDHIDLYIDGQLARTDQASDLRWSNNGDLVRVEIVVGIDAGRSNVYLPFLTR